MGRIVGEISSSITGKIFGGVPESILEETSGKTFAVMREEIIEEPVRLSGSIVLASSI